MLEHHRQSCISEQQGARVNKPACQQPHYPASCVKLTPHSPKWPNSLAVLTDHSRLIYNCNCFALDTNSTDVHIHLMRSNLDLTLTKNNAQPLCANYRTEFTVIVSPCGEIADAPYHLMLSPVSLCSQLHNSVQCSLT